MRKWIRRITTARYYGNIFRRNAPQLDRLSKLLDDQPSRLVLRRILSAYKAVWRRPVYYLSRAALRECSEYHFTAEDGYIVRGTRNPYFLSEIFRFDEPMILLDGGAYIGDTVELALKEERLPCRRIYAFEPNRENYRKLIGVAERYSSVVVCYNKGLDDHDARVRFRENDAGSRIDDSGECMIEVIDTGAFLHQLEEDRPTFIKLDIEGKEQDVLRSAADYISRERPDMAVSIYHRLEDLWEIPLLLSNICPDYRLYIRHQSNYYTETVCYATVRRS